MKPASTDGAGPYAFVCYAHADSDRVYPLISHLQGQGIQIWYDQGITPGEEWTEELSQAIENADQFLFFVSPASAESRHCRNEVRHAVNHDKRIVTAYLEPTPLSGGLELLVGGSQAIAIHEHAAPGDILLEALRRKSVVSARSRSRTRPARAAALAATLLAAVAGVYWWANPTEEQTPPPNPAEPQTPALAVMPFSSVNGTPEGTSLAKGVHADVMSHLFRLSEIVVMSARAAEQFDAARPREVADQLKVSHLLEGSVQSAGEQVRVSVGLIDAPTERRIWSQQYDRQLSDIFAIQSEIALSVANQLAVKLSPEQIDEIGEIPTENMAAFRLVIRARASDDQDHKLELLEQALEIDPEYAEAHRRISATLRRSVLEPSVVQEKMVHHADAALRFAPNDPYAHLERGEVSGWPNSPPDLTHIRRAYELAPNNTLIANTLAIALAFAGREPEAVPLLEDIRRRDGNFRPVPLRFWMDGDYDSYGEAIRTEIEFMLGANLDPSGCDKDPGCEFRNTEEHRAYELAKLHRNDNNYVQLVEYLYKARYMRKPKAAVPIDVPRFIAEAFHQLGDYEASDKWLEYLDRDGPDPAVAFKKTTLYRERGDTARLSAHIERWKTIDPEFVSNLESSLQRARVLETSDPAARRALNDKIYQHAQRYLSANQNYAAGKLPFPPELSLYFAIGVAPTDPDEAAHIAALVIDHFAQGAINTVQGYNVIGRRYALLTYAHALRGEVDIALKNYQEAERYAYRDGLGWGGVYRDPDNIYHGLAKHPEFQRIDKRIKAKNAADIATIKREFPFTRDPYARPGDV